MLNVKQNNNKIQTNNNKKQQKILIFFKFLNAITKTNKLNDFAII